MKTKPSDLHIRTILLLLLLLLLLPTLLLLPPPPPVCHLNARTPNRCMYLAHVTPLLLLLLLLLMLLLLLLLLLTWCACLGRTWPSQAAAKTLLSHTRHMTQTECNLLHTAALRRLCKRAAKQIKKHHSR